MIETKNAMIKGVNIGNDRGVLIIDMSLDYGDCGQGFGGYVLYKEKSSNTNDLTGLFMWRVMQIAGVDSWDKLIGRTIRVKSDIRQVYEIGHILNDDWFNPEEEFKGKV